jgi:hypothetical protein
MGCMTCTNTFSLFFVLLYTYYVSYPGVRFIQSNVLLDAYPGYIHGNEL